MAVQKRAVVCGAGGFIGGHLVSFLKEKGYWVRGVDIKQPEFGLSSADEFLVLDLRQADNCCRAMGGKTADVDEVYQLAADMGGMGFIHSAECEIMRNSALININMIDAAASMGIKRYFFSSSVCIYRDMAADEPEMKEEGAYPAQPDNEYGWEKLYSERMCMAYARRFGMAVRIGRFQNCYGALGTWRGGREKAPAAICRKVAEAKDGGEIEIWGDGTAIRSYTHVDDMVEGIFLLTQSNLEGGVNIGCPEYVSVNELAEVAIRVSGKNLTIKHIDGPVGVHSRNFSNERIYSIGWKPHVFLLEGVRRTYTWVQSQVEKSRKEVLDGAVCNVQSAGSMLNELVDGSGTETERQNPTATQVGRHS